MTAANGNAVESSRARQTSPDEKNLAGKRVAFVGRLTGMNRKQLRELVREHGGVAADVASGNFDLLVVGEGSSPLTNEVLENEGLADSAASGQIQVLDETGFWQELGLVDHETDARRLYTPGMLAELLSVPIATIRRWHRRGLISSVRNVHKLPYFDFEEVTSARHIAELISSGASPNAIEAKLSRLSGLFPKLERPLTQLQVIAEGREILLRAGSGLIEPGGQRRFDFFSPPQSDEPASEPKVFSLQPLLANRELENLQQPEDFLSLAVEFEDADELASACEVYRSLMIAFGPTADVCFRLAENLFQLGDLSAARERYYSAIELDEELVEARASLGCLLVEQGDFELAISAFRGALDYHTDYPDVLYHLARVLDQTGASQQAEVHWQRFLKLTPESPWAEEARFRLGLSDS